MYVYEQRRIVAGNEHWNHELLMHQIEIKENTT